MNFKNWWQKYGDVEHSPDDLAWKECQKCRCFFSNDDDGTLTKEGIWICNKCNAIIENEI